MKKQLLSTLLFLMFCIGMKAQVSAYSFSQTSTSYVAIPTTGATTLHATGWDDGIATATIPFSFYFAGATYTTCSVNSNGYLTFGTTTSGTTGYTPIAATTGYNGAISAFARDLTDGPSGAQNPIICNTIGTAPNRTFVVQWSNARRYFGSASLAGDLYNFQICLNEGGGIATSQSITILYGACTATNTSTGVTVQVGLRGLTNADFNDRNTATDWATTTLGAANTATCVTSPTINPVSGLAFNYMPPAACTSPTAQPTGLVFGGVTNAAVNGTFTPIVAGTTPGYLVIRTLGTAPNTPTNGVTYTTGASTPLAGTVVAVGTSSTFATTGLTGNTNYSYYIYSYTSVNCTGGPLYYTVSPLTGTVTTCPAKATAVTNTLVTTNSFNLSWTAPAGGTASPITYSVEVSTNAGFTAPIAGSPFLIPAPTTSLSLTGLNPATTYYYRVSADNGCNTGPQTAANITTSVIATDLQTVQLIAPVVNGFGCYNSSIPVIIQVKNAGGTVLDFSTNNATVITNITGPNPQSFTTTISTGTLAASATQNVTVTTTYNMSAVGVYTVNASSTLATPDANPSNNAMAAVTRTVTSGSTLPIINPFTGYDGSNLATLFPLWSEAAGAVTPSGTTSGWLSQTGLNGTGNITAKINLYTTTANEWILTPKFTVAAGVNMTFDAAVTEYNALIPDPSNAMNGTDDKVDVMISTDCGASYTSLLSIGQSYSLTPAFKSFSVSLASYVGQSVIIGFKATDGPVDNINDYDFHIDNVNLNTCFPPIALTTTNTTTNSTDLTWTAPAFGTPNYVYEIRTSGAAGSGATGLVTTGTVTAPSTSVTATGLTLSTSYSVYVRSDCGSGNFSLWTPVKTFTTPAACPMPSVPNVTNITGFTAVATWTAGATETLWDIYYGSSPLTVPTATTAPTATASATPSYTISALTPTTGYAVYVRANCGAGNLSAWTALKTFTTTVSCPAPSAAVISAITPTTAIATWTAGGAETTWFVKYSAPTTTVSVSGTPSYTLTGLTPSTTYSVQVRGFCGVSDTSAYTTLVTFMTPCAPPNITGTTPGSRCGIGTTTLGVTGDPGATFKWYTAPTGGSSVATGSVFTTPTLTNTTNYYVSATGGLSVLSVGSPSTSGANGTNTSGAYLIFDALSAFTLNSVVIYPGGSGAGTVVIALQNSAGVTLQTATVAATGAATAVAQLAPLNFTVAPGTGYRLNYLSSTGGVTSMFRESSGTVYPFTLPGVVSITGASLAGGYYYYFYNWQVATGCESNRTMVAANVSAPPALSLSTTTTVCANVISTVSVTSIIANYDSYVWAPLTNLYSDAAATTPYTGGTATAVYYKSAVAGSTTYTVNATNSGSGCANIASTTRTTDVPVINATATPSMVCSGAAVTLSATTNIVGSGTVAIGTATTLTSPTSQPTAFCNRWVSYRMQTVYTAAELSAAGLYAGNITSIAYKITSLGDGATNPNFTVKCGTTTVSAFTDFISSAGFTTVFPAATYTHAVGVNTITFNTPYFWDGVSNLVVEVSHDGANNINNAETYYTLTAGNTVAHSYNGNATGTLSNNRLNIIFAGQAGTSGPGSLSWQWNPGAVNSNTTTVNPVNTGTNPAVSSYTISGTNPATTCSNTAVVNVTVNPVPTIPVVANSLQCGVGTPTASVSGGATYKWYAAPTSTTVLQSGASSTYTSAISVTTTFYVSSYNANCESARTAVTASVNIPDAITATSTSTAVCPGQSFTLTATNTGTNNVYSYTWAATPATGSGIATSVTGATTAVTPVTPGSYNYKVTGADAVCTTTAAVTVMLSAPPQIMATANPSVSCSGSTVTLNAVTPAIGSGTAAIGTGTVVTTTTEELTAFCNRRLNYRQQTLYTAAELTAAGISAGNITSISYSITTIGDAAGNANFTVKCGSVVATAFTDYVPTTGFITVFPSATYTHASGANTINFSTPYFWDGVSNLVVEVSHDGIDALYNAQTYYETLTVNRTVYGYNSATVGTVSMKRFNTILVGQVLTTGAGAYTWQWNPGAINSNTTTVAPVNPGPGSTNPTYTITALDPATTCSNTAVVTLTVNPIPTVTVAASTGSICSGTTASLTATGATTYSWMPAGGTASVAVVSPTANTVYTVTGTSLGCTNTQTVNLNVTATPTVVASASPSVICAGATLTLTASGATTYSWMPNSSASGTTTATPTVSTIYTVTGTTAGCSNTKTVSTTVNTIPTLTVTTNPAGGALCTSGATATLTAAGTSTSYAWSNSANTASTSVAPSATTVYSVSGTNSCGTTTAAVTIAVATTPTISATSSSTLSCTNNTVVLTAGATPGVTYSWNTGASTMSISVSPSVTTTYTVTGSNACGTATATVVQNVSLCTGIDVITGGDAISIYPNPATDYVNIAIPASLTAGNTTVEVTDALGKVVMHETLNTDMTTLKITKLEDGVYFFKVITNSQVIKVGKIVKN
jgi:hypothetical protein